jgi:hypothetical protein
MSTKIEPKVCEHLQANPHITCVGIPDADGITPLLICGSCFADRVKADCKAAGVNADSEKVVQKLLDSASFKNCRHANGKHDCSKCMRQLMSRLADKVQFLSTLTAKQKPSGVAKYERPRMETRGGAQATWRTGHASFAIPPDLTNVQTTQQRASKVPKYQSSLGASRAAFRGEYAVVENYTETDCQVAIGDGLHNGAALVREVARPTDPLQI